ncbi:4-hydroxy-tetrahydrodipicolinate synthase [Thermococcus barophilus]|uniref:4-hydroxy-tetrahydrodipicolinate synthase n=2 Tax=Thermococcus barophilus TaxID=55802 RepID=A0A0S1XFP2_THEBA|nr:4-hydroxy-tetrahydrodipicolinate synthase [Thermococcus barophilus]ADT82999.1 dihydrodipicolinate synthase [Thermococcus barophilus MP]ALM76558.1 4-hydroxy-tetrahydrodipicolinate synthase [Thermococcus barophilus]
MIEGIFPPVVTPFKEDESIDEERFASFLEFLVKRKVSGLFLLGTNGEGLSLENEEKIRIMEIAVETVKGKVPVIAGTGAITTRETIKLSKEAERIGVDAIHVIVPYYYPLSREGILRHYAKVSQEVDLPILIYYIPSRTGNKIDVKMLCELAKLRNIIGIKDSSKDVTWFYNAIMAVKKENPDFVFLGGSDALIYTHLMLGGNGAVSAIANAFPEIVIELYREFRAGNLAKAKEIQDRILIIRQILKKYPYLSGIKAALKLRGIDMGVLRSPLVFLNEDQLQCLREELKAVGVI